MSRFAWLAHVVALLVTPVWAAAAEPAWADADELPPVVIPAIDDFVREADVARERQLPILVMFYAEHCGWCTRVEEEFLKPMIRSGDYADRVLFRRLRIDADTPVTGFRGERTTPAAIAADYGVRVTPTLLFLGADGRQIAPRMVGMTTPDYYGGYLDDAIFTALTGVRGEPVRAAAAETPQAATPR